MRISDWSSDVCSSDLVLPPLATPNNPLDVTGAAMIEPELIARSLKALAQDPQIAELSFAFDAQPKEDARGCARRFIGQTGAGRSEDRRVGKAWVRTGQSRGSQ